MDRIMGDVDQIDPRILGPRNTCLLRWTRTNPPLQLLSSGGPMLVRKGWYLGVTALPFHSLVLGDDPLKFSHPKPIRANLIVRQEQPAQCHLRRGALHRVRHERDYSRRGGHRGYAPERAEADSDRHSWHPETIQGVWEEGG